MADVRALLRAERASRAPPTQAKIPSKPAPLTPALVNRKRKAADEDNETRKRVAFEDVSVDSANEDPVTQTTSSPDNLEAGVAEKIQAPVQDIIPKSAPEQVRPQQTLDVDEDEWAAFERDVAAPTHPAALNVLDAINASTAIASAPLTAEELAAQAREEQSAQKSRQDAETEGEKEDAEQALAEEFDEMEALELRVKKLRERREQLRHDKKGSETQIKDAGSVLESGTQPGLSERDKDKPPKAPDPSIEKDQDEDEEEDEDYDEEDEFMFRRRNI